MLGIDSVPEGRLYNALEPVGDNGTDYELRFESCWIIVDDVSLWIRKNDDGSVTVEACREGNEADETLDTMEVRCIEKS